METIIRLKTVWKKEFNCDIPTEFVARLECQTSSAQSNSSGHVIHALTAAREQTGLLIDDLKSKLLQEQLFFNFLNSEIDTSHPENMQSGIIGVEDLYAKVNKPIKSKQTESENLNMVQTNQNLSLTRRNVSAYEEIKVEIIEKEESKPVEKKSNISPKRMMRGSVKDKIKMFDVRSESSSSDESGGDDGDYETLVIKPSVSPRPSRASGRRQPRINDYEEVCLPLTGQTSSPVNTNSKPIAPSDTNIHMPINKPTALKSDSPTQHAVKEADQTSCVKQTNEHEVKSKQFKTPPPVPLRRSKGKETQKETETTSFDVLKKTENLTLKQSDHEPQISTASLKKRKDSTKENVKLREVVDVTDVNRKINESIGDIEGDYCSIADAASLNSKHVTLVQVKSNEDSSSVNKHNDIISSGDCDRNGNLKNVTVLSVKRSDRELSRSEENLHKIGKKRAPLPPPLSRSTEHINHRPHDYEDIEVSSFMPIGGGPEKNTEMKKLFNRKSGGTLNSHDAGDESPVVGKKFTSLSSNSSSDEDLTKTVPINVTDIVKENDHDDSNVVDKSPKISRRVKEKRQHVPDYEKWNFQTLLTKQGISVADHEHFTDMGSDDDINIYDNVPDNPETVSGQSDDSGVCETLTPDEKSQSALDQVDGDIVNVQEKSAVGSRISTASCITVDGDSVFLQRCDSIDSPSIPATLREERTSQEDDTCSLFSLDDQLDKPDSPETEKKELKYRTEQLRMRHLVVKGILESEKSYLHVIEQLVKAKHFLQSAALKPNSGIAPADVTTIFYKLEDIFQVHKEFVDTLEQKMKDWSDDQNIAGAFKLLVVYFKVYEEYVNNYAVAVETIHKYQENEDTRQLLEKVFKTRLRLASVADEQMDMCKDEAVKLEDILLKPVQRIQTNNLVLHDLLMHTPEDHPDHPDLKKALKLSEENLKTYNSQPGNIDSNNPQESSHLVKSGFVVEVSKDKKNSRQLRYAFLFSDVLICTKHKTSSKHKEVSFKYLWSLPVGPLSIHVKGEQKYSLKESLDDLKFKIGSLKVELREEMLKVDSFKDKAFSISQRRAIRNVEKLKKKIQEQEATLVEGLPRLPLNLEVEGFKSHTFLFPTDYERQEWREVLEAQHHKFEDIAPGQLSAHDYETMINNTKLHTQVNGIGTVLLKKDEEMLNGSLNVTIHKMQGLDTHCDVCCCLEMDSYGHFYKKAQTRVAKNINDASWDQDFELDLDGSQTLRLLCYQKMPDHEDDIIIGKCALELSLAWLNSKFNEKTISMNEISITISIRHSPASKTLKRTQSKLRTGIFGVNIATVTRRECKTVPSVVTICVQEVEKRGFEEVGIYRVSGVTSDIQHMKKLFDKNPIAANAQMEDADIHAITGVLKLYFRELPEPLFTDQHYQAFVQTIELQNQETKEKCMMELLHSLPEANYYTIVYMIEHLVRVAKQSTLNKMSISNLSTIFGPTLLHPAMKDSNVDPMIMMVRAARDAAVQSEVVHFFMKLALSGRNLRKSASSDL